MANLVLDFHSININSVPQLTLPVAVVTDPNGAGGGLLYQGASYGDVEFPAQRRRTRRPSTSCSASVRTPIR